MAELFRILVQSSGSPKCDYTVQTQSLRLKLLSLDNTKKSKKSFFTDCSWLAILAEQFSSIFYINLIFFC